MTISIAPDARTTRPQPSHRNSPLHAGRLILNNVRSTGDPTKRAAQIPIRDECQVKWLVHSRLIDTVESR